jgi:Flp pilus assembly pilin Flp
VDRDAEFGNFCWDTSSLSHKRPGRKEIIMTPLHYDLRKDERGQDIAEYAVMLAVILVLVVGTVRLIGSNANNAFSAVASSIQ